MSRHQVSSKEVFKDEEINLKEVFFLFWRKRKIIFYTTIVGVVISLLVYGTSNKEYSSESIILTEVNNSGRDNLKGLGGLAGLAGVNLPNNMSGNQGDLNPMLYPRILESQPFLLELIQSSFYSEDYDAEVELIQYLNEFDDRNIFKRIFDGVKNPSSIFRSGTPYEPSNLAEGSESSAKIRKLSSHELKAISRLRNRVQIETDPETFRFVTLKVKMPEPELSAEVNQKVLEKIIEYVVSYKTEKQKHNVSVIAANTENSKQNFEKAQMKLASFRDSNRGIVSQAFKTREEQLQSEYSIAFNVYNNLATQLEQAKIVLAEETPIFTEFQPVTVPVTHSEPNFLKIMLLFVLLGIVIGGAIIFFVIVREVLF